MRYVLKRTLSTTCLTGETKANIENNLCKRKEKNTRQISAKAENKHLSEKNNEIANERIDAKFLAN